MKKSYIFNGKSANQFIVENAPPVVRYIQDFITLEEEQSLLSHIDSVPAPKWQHLRDRRVQSWGGVVGKSGLIPDTGFPKWLEEIVDKLVAVPDIFPHDLRPNYVLINDYHPGNGIMHTDGPAYYPVVATISLGNGLMMDYTRGIDPNVTECFEDRYVGSMFLEPRSLLLLSDAMFSSYLHGIANRTVDVITKDTYNKDIVGKDVGSVIQRNRRISLTVRNVPKVRRNIASFLKK